MVVVWRICFGLLYCWLVSQLTQPRQLTLACQQANSYKPTFKQKLLLRQLLHRRCPFCTNTSCILLGMLVCSVCALLRRYLPQSQEGSVFPPENFGKKEKAAGPITYGPVLAKDSFFVFLHFVSKTSLRWGFIECFFSNLCFVHNYKESQQH